MYNQTEIAFTNATELEEREKELKHIKAEIKEITSDRYLRPNEIMCKLRELKGTLKHCQEEYDQLAKHVRKNYL